MSAYRASRTAAVSLTLLRRLTSWTACSATCSCRESNLPGAVPFSFAVMSSIVDNEKQGKENVDVEEVKKRRDRGGPFFLLKK